MTVYITRLTYKLHRDGVPVNVNERPDGTVRVHSAKEQSVLLSVHTIHHIAASRHVEEQHRVLLGVPLGQRLRPIARLIREVRARIARQLGAVDRRWVAGREAEAYDAAPARGHIAELDVDALVDGDRAVAEADALAEALDAVRPTLVGRQLDMVTVGRVKLQWIALHRIRAQVRRTCNKRQHYIIIIIFIWYSATSIIVRGGSQHNYYNLKDIKIYMYTIR